MRGRSPSYSPPPRRRRGRSPSPRGRYPTRREPLTSLLVRNLGKDWRADDLRAPFGKFGPLRDVYLPKDYYTGESRGFGFVQYFDPFDAEEAQYYMNHRILYGREITVVFAEENRKKPSEMRSRERARGRSFSGYEGGARSSYSGRSVSRSRSRSPRRRSRSPSEDDGRDHGRFHSRSPARGRSPIKHSRYEDDESQKERSYSGSPVRSSTPVRDRKERNLSHSKISRDRGTKSPPRSPSLPPRRRRPSPAGSPSESPAEKRSGDRGDSHASSSASDY